MRVRRVDKDGDWTFGQGLANYAKDNEAVGQNVATRIKSFKNDWFLDTAAHIDWFSILSNRNTEKIIVDQVRRVARDTYGVKNVNYVNLLSSHEELEMREARIRISLTTIFGTLLTQDIKIQDTY